MHEHMGRLNKRELARHLTTPHARKGGGWSLVAGPVSAVAKWRRDEMDRTHAEFHDVPHNPGCRCNRCVDGRESVERAEDY